MVHIQFGASVIEETCIAVCLQHRRIHILSLPRATHQDHHQAPLPEPIPSEENIDRWIASD